MRRRFFVCALMLAVPAALAAQFPRLGDVLSRTPGLARILNAKDALTTSLSMATNGVPVIDLFEPSVTTAMASAPRSADGGFTLEPGAVYELRAQSFCLLAGSRGPGKGAGHLDAPLVGPMGDVVQHILEGASTHPNLAQADIQMLLWSILAHAKVTDLSRHLQGVAAQLLTPSELIKVNGGALGLIPDAVKDAAFARLPPVVARAVAAEASLRDLISRGAASYEEMERIAVLDGVDDEPGVEIPRERWNFRDGMFIRYLPDGYQETVIQVYVPGYSPQMGVERDRLGRLARLTDDLSRTIEITYDDAVAPRTFSGDAGVKAWAIKHVAYSRPADGGRRVDNADVDAWTLVGTPNGRGVISRVISDAPHRYVLLPASFRVGAFSPAWRASRGGDDVSDDIADRYRRASDHKDWYDKVKDARDRSQGKGPSADDVIDENHYEDGLEKAKELDFAGEAEWLKDHNDSLGRMAARTHCYLVGACTDAKPAPRPFKPSRGVAVPGGSGGQRLGQSGRSR